MFRCFTVTHFVLLQMKRFDCVLVSVHLKATGLDNEDLSRLQEEIDKMPNLVDAIEEHLPGEKDIIVLGDFNLSPNTEGRIILMSDTTCCVVYLNERCYVPINVFPQRGGGGGDTLGNRAKAVTTPRN